MGLRALIREFINEITAKRGTSPYDTEAEVLRVEDGKAWVRIPGGVPETPVDVGMNAEKGDIVTVRVSGGKAWLQNNITHPATDDRAAKAAQKLALSAGMKADTVQREADKLVVITNNQGEQIGYAITTANGKNKTYHQASEPTGGEYAVGDVWFDTDDDNKMYRWNGSSWAAVVLGDDALESISASKITAGTIDASQITVSNLDAGNITSGYLAAARIEAGSLSISKTSGLQTALDGKAGTSAATGEEQLIYISKASGTTSVSQNTTWVTRSDDVQNTWTLKRPTYSSSYPVLFIAKQNKKVDGTITCTTPVKDDTTTVIDGGHITTGIIDAARLNVADIISSGNILVVGDDISDLNNDSGYQTAGDVSTAISGKADKSGVIASTVPVYYRSTTSSTPSISSSTSIGTSSSTDDAWEYVMPQPKRSGYFFICEKYTYANGTVGFSTVRELTSENYASKWCSSSDSTYIDGGRIYTGSITANEIAANTITANELAAYAVKVIGTNANNYAQMDSNGMVVYKGGYLSASFGGTVYLYGRDSNGNVHSTVKIDSSSANINGFDIQTTTNSSGTFTECESTYGLRLIGAGTTLGLYSAHAILDNDLHVSGVIDAYNVHEIATASPTARNALSTNYAELILEHDTSEGALVIGNNLSIIPWDEGLSYSGIKCLKAGHVLVSGQARFFDVNDSNVCALKIRAGSKDVAESKARSSGDRTEVTITPRLISVSANTIIHIYAANTSAAAGYAGGDSTTITDEDRRKNYLTVQYV